ncbi:MAG TPA: hypothetical protein VF326_13720 [Anaerolineaceae bacterium]
MDGTTTNYVLDMTAALTSVLADRMDTYLYGDERLAQFQVAQHQGISSGMCWGALCSGQTARGR